LVDQSSSDKFRPEAYEDDVKKRIQEQLKHKIDTGEEISAQPRPKTGEIIDLMEALRKSLAQTSASSRKNESASERKPAKRAARTPEKKAARRYARAVGCQLTARGLCRNRHNRTSAVLARPVAESGEPKAVSFLLVPGYSTRDISRLIGLSPTQVRSFVRSGLIFPERGPGRRFRFSFEDLVFLKAAKELLSARVGPRRIRRALAKLRQELPPGRRLSGLQLTAEGRRL